MLGDDGSFPTAMEARAAAYSKGWRFPQRIAESSKPNARTYDICADCHPTWPPP
jgi:hypothetical protein